MLGKRTHEQAEIGLDDLTADLSKDNNTEECGMATTTDVEYNA